MHRHSRSVVNTLLSLLLLVFLCAALIAVANAHSWYDVKCCSGIDCAPVADGVVSEKADGVHVKGFETVLPYGDERIHVSKDDRDHVCAIPGTTRLLCVYVKPKGF